MNAPQDNDDAPGTPRKRGRKKGAEPQSAPQGSPQPGAPQGANAPVKPARKPRRRRSPGSLPSFHVVLLNDDDHSFDYVIEMLKALFGHPEPTGLQLAREVDSAGRVVVMTTHKELAELKCEQVRAYGADPRIQNSRGSMTAVIEPVK